MDRCIFLLSFFLSHETKFMRKDAEARNEKGVALEVFACFCQLLSVRGWRTWSFEKPKFFCCANSRDMRLFLVFVGGFSDGEKERNLTGLFRFSGIGNETILIGIDMSNK